mmetsp:Transcript_3256/g.4804  ORF Transcript_3256/g.4804 Transcript_3256/m.4804 type:complete len:1393 (+) Transcript_3256:51-4229(+)
MSQSFLKLLLRETTNLATEAKKQGKIPIFETATKEQNFIKELQKESDEIKRKEKLSKHQELINPFIRACESKNPKLLNTSLTSLQFILSHNAINNEGGYGIIIETITMLSRYPNCDEATQLKLLQLAFTIVTTTSFKLNERFLSKILGLCFRLYHNQSINVSSTAIAAINQTTSVIFETLVKATKDQEEKSEGENNEEEKSIEKHVFSTAKSAYLYIADLCVLAQGDNEAQWLKVQQVNISFIFEILAEIFSHYATTLIKYQEFVTIIRDKVFDILLKHLAVNHHIETQSRLYTVVGSILKLSHIPELHTRTIQLLNTLNAIISENALRESIQPYVIYSLEVFRNVCSDHHFLTQLSIEMKKIKQNKSKSEVASGGQHEHPIAIIVNTVRYCVMKLLDNTNHSYESYQHSAHKQKRLTKHFASEAFFGTPEECLTLCVDCLIALVSSMNIIISANPANESQLELCAELIELLIPQILLTLTRLLDTCNTEDSIHTILQTFTLLIHCCSSTHCTGARDTFLTHLCKGTPSATYDPDIPAVTHKKIYVAQSVFDIAHVLGAQFGSAWLIIVSSLKELAPLLYTSAFRDYPNEYKQLTKSLANVYSKTPTYTDVQLQEMLRDGICKAVDQALEDRSELPSLYAIDSMITIVKLNSFRIHVIWDIVQQKILDLIDHPNEKIREVGVNHILDISQSLYTDKEGPESPTQIDSDKRNIELDVFSLLLTISTSKYKDLKVLMINKLSTVIEQAGENLTSAWTIILTVLRGIDVDSLIPTAFKSVQHIGNLLSFLTVDGLIEYMKTVEFYATQSSTDKFTINLVAISLLWNLADYLVKNYANHERKMDLWYTLFTTLKSPAFDERAEVRRAAIRSLMFAIASHGAQLNIDTWSKVLQKILLPTLRNIRKNAENAPDEKVSNNHHSRDTAKKQWSETRCLAIEGISRVVKEHSSICSEIPMFVSEAIPLIMDYIHASCFTKTSQVSKIILKSLTDMLRGTRGDVQITIWKESLKIWGLFASFAEAGERFMNSTLIYNWVEEIRQLYIDQQDSQNIFTPDDRVVIIQILTRIILSKAACSRHAHPTDAQSRCILAIDEFVKNSEEVKIGAVRCYNNTIMTLPLDNPDNEDALHVDVCRILFEKLMGFYQLISVKNQQSLFGDIVQLHGFLLQTKSLSIDYPMWVVSIKSLQTILSKPQFFENNVSMDTLLVDIKKFFEYKNIEESSEDVMELTLLFVLQNSVIKLNSFDSVMSSAQKEKLISIFAHCTLHLFDHASSISARAFHSLVELVSLSQVDLEYQQITVVTIHQIIQDVLNSENCNVQHFLMLLEELNELRIQNPKIYEKLDDSITHGFGIQQKLYPYVVRNIPRLYELAANENLGSHFSTTLSHFLGPLTQIMTNK